MGRAVRPHNIVPNRTFIVEFFGPDSESPLHATIALPHR
jgi:hypothetical protein